MAGQLTVHVLVHGNNDKLAVSVASDATTCVPGASAAPPPARPTARPPARQLTPAPPARPAAPRRAAPRRAERT